MTRLVITRRVEESFRIGTDVTVTILHLSQGQARIAIEAPKEVPILRTELVERDRKERLDAEACQP